MKKTYSFSQPFSFHFFSRFLVLLLYFAVIFSFFITSCKSVPQESDFESVSSPSIRLAPNVTVEMLQPAFWISRSENPSKIRMSRSEIARWNRQVIYERYPKNSSFGIVSDLRRYDSVMTGSEVRNGIMSYPKKSVWYKKVLVKNNEEIKALSKKDWKVISAEMNLPEKDSDCPVRKGVCVARSNLRVIPDDTFYTDDRNYWYDDIAQNSGILMNEPVLVLWESKSKAWLYVKASFCSGWIHAEDIAFCSDEEFLRRFDYAEKSPDDFVTIVSDRFTLPEEYIVFNTEKKYKLSSELFMGTYLFTCDWKNSNLDDAFLHRLPYANYLVELPYRREDGSLGFYYASVPAGVCNYGLVNYTTENVLKLAFMPLGKHYGWGGTRESRDCSEYLKDIFRCFGFMFARNSRAQLAMSGKTIDFEGKSLSAKASLLSSLEGGTPMGFPGHVFLYLGKAGNKYYVISALGSYYFEEKSEEESCQQAGSFENPLLKIEANSVSINTLDVKRKNGDTWLSMLTRAKLLENDGSWSDKRVFLEPQWQFADYSKINSGYSVLYKADTKNRKNIVVAVNAGHGTKGGSLLKTFSHPDKSPKLTGGTTAAGEVESICVSGGMTFKDSKSEAEVNLRTARLFKRLLLNKGYDVLMIRDCDDVQLDNIARTVIASNNAGIHIAIHYDGDGLKEDKGCFYCSIPEGLKELPNVKGHFDESQRLGDCLIEGLKRQNLPVYNDGKKEVDLTQTSYSTIPTVDIELGNQATETKTSELEKRAKGLLEGVELFFNKQ